MKNYFTVILCLLTWHSYTQAFTDYNDFYGIDIRDSFLPFGRIYVELYGVTLEQLSYKGVIRFPFEKERYIKNKCRDNFDCRNSLLDEEYFSLFDETIIYFLPADAEDINEVIPRVIESNKTYTSEEFDLNSEQDFISVLNFLKKKFSTPTNSITHELYNAVEWKIGKDKILSLQRRFDDEALRVYYLIEV